MTDVVVNSAAGNQTIALNQIQFDRSVTPGAVPTAASMEEGALAINLADRKIFTKDQTGAVVSLGKDYTGEIAAAQAAATAASNAYTDSEIAAIEGGTLDGTLDTLLKLGNRLLQAEADIVSGGDNLANLTKADLGLGNVENYGISDSVTEANSEQYASSAAVKIAYDRAVTAESTAITYADQVKSDLLGGAAPEALDTLAELATALQGNDDDIAAIVNTLATKAAQADVDAGLALKVDIASISSAIDSTSETNVASSKAVKDSLDAAKAYADAGLALKVDIASISDAIDSQSQTNVASSKAVDDARQQAVAHANSMVLGLAANMDYGVTF